MQHDVAAALANFLSLSSSLLSSGVSFRQTSKRCLANCSRPHGSDSGAVFWDRISGKCGWGRSRDKLERALIAWKHIRWGCSHCVIVSKVQWKPFWLATQLYPQNDSLGGNFFPYTMSTAYNFNCTSNVSQFRNRQQSRVHPHRKTWRSQQQLWCLWRLPVLFHWLTCSLFAVCFSEKILMLVQPLSKRRVVCGPRWQLRLRLSYWSGRRNLQKWVQPRDKKGLEPPSLHPGREINALLQLQS